MKILKYVINDVGQPIIFSVDNLHSDILTNVVSAGFVIIDYNYENEFFFVKCFGASSSLGVTSRVIDDEIIERHINGFLFGELEQKNWKH